MNQLVSFKDGQRIEGGTKQTVGLLHLSGGDGQQRRRQEGRLGTLGPRRLNDLLEELARVYGYNRLPVQHIRADLEIPARDERELSPRHLRRHLAARGYREAITYSFIEPRLQAMFDPEQAAVPLKNPISADMSVMRTSLLPGLVSAVQHNLNRQQSRVCHPKSMLDTKREKAKLCSRKSIFCLYKYKMKIFMLKDKLFWIHEDLR